MTRDSNLAVLMLAHANPGVFAKLTAALVHPRIAVFCHIDSKADQARFESVAPKGVTFIQDRFNVAWGGYAMIEAELAMFRAARLAGPFGTYAVISGDSLPLLTNEALLSTLRPVAHTLQTTRQMPADHGYLRYERIFLPDTTLGGFRGRKYFERHLQRSDFDMLRRAMASADLALRSELRFFKGSQWFSISDTLLARMLDYLAATPEYEEILRFTAIPDESFFQTLLRIVEPEAGRTFALVGVDWSREPLPYVYRSDADFDGIRAARSPFFRKFSDDCLSLVEKVLAHRASPADLASRRASRGQPASSQEPRQDAAAGTAWGRSPHEP